MDDFNLTNRQTTSNDTIQDRSNQESINNNSYPLLNHIFNNNQTKNMFIQFEHIFEKEFK